MFSSLYCERRITQNDSDKKKNNILVLDFLVLGELLFALSIHMHRTNTVSDKIILMTGSIWTEELGAVSSTFYSVIRLINGV